MSDLEKELLDDLEDLDGDLPDEEQQNNYQRREGSYEDFAPSKTGSLIEQIRAVVKKSSTNVWRQGLLQANINILLDVLESSLVYPLIPSLKAKMADFMDKTNSDYFDLLTSIGNNHSEEYEFILLMNEFTQVINDEVQFAFSFLKLHYRVVFSELEALVLNPVDYAKIVLTIKQDLPNIKSYQTDLSHIISNEKVLVIVMAAVQHLKSNFHIDDSDLNMILKAGLFIMDLENLKNSISEFISSKLSKAAPNVCALLGSLLSSQLLIATGSLKQLSITPSCNLASFGTKELSSTSRGRASRQTGYLANSDLVSELPLSIIRPALRILSGKIILAARIDFSKASPNGEKGSQFRQEVFEKIEKLLKPPEIQPDKALPAPVEQKSKKRGGRRFRKMKERTQMSELRKAQNKMEFGKQEDTYIDEFGDEIGLGMSRKANNGLLSIKVNSNTKAKMSKSMMNRLNTNTPAQSMNDDFGDLFSLDAPSTPNRDDASSMSNMKWHVEMKKRKPADIPPDNNKRMKL